MAGQQLTLGVLDDARDLALHDGNSRVGGTEINTDDGSLDLALALGSRSRLIASKLGRKGSSGEGRASGVGGSPGKLSKKDKLAMLRHSEKGARDCAAR